MAFYCINLVICATLHLPFSNQRHYLLTPEKLNKIVFTCEDKILSTNSLRKCMAISGEFVFGFLELKGLRDS